MKKGLKRCAVLLLCIFTFSLIDTSMFTIIAKADTTLTPIMGQGSLNKNQMINSLLNRNKRLTVREICDFVDFTISEANIEGVNYDILFSQMMLETNYLNFGGDVQASQNNFAGIGATGGGNPGNSFPTVQIGIRAVVQHLKAYASTEPLKQSCVDPRFQYVKRSSAEYVEYLGIQENPNGAGWASAKDYGKSILNILSSVKTYSVQPMYSLINELNLSNGEYAVNKEIQITTKGTPENSTMYKIAACDRSTGQWVILSNWSNKSSVKYIPKNPGTHRIVVYVKHSSKSSDVEDDYRYVDINVVPTKSQVNSINVVGEQYINSNLKIDAVGTPENDTLYKFSAVDRSTGKWVTLSDWSTNTTVTYTPKNPGTHRVVVYVKHKTYGGSEEDDYKYVDLTINPLVSSVGSLNVTGEQYVKSTLTVKSTASPTDNTLYKFSAVDRSTGQWVTLSNWSTNTTVTYTPKNPGAHRIVVYVKHKTKSGDIEDDYKYVDLTINPLVSSVESLNVTGEQYVKSTLTVKSTASPKDDTLYKFSAVDRSTGQWVTLSNWSTNTTVTYTPKNPGTHRIVVYVKHKTKSGDVEDDYKYVDLAIKQGVSSISKVNVNGNLTANSTLEISGNAEPNTGTLYKISVGDRNTGKWTTLSDWSTNNSALYTPLFSGTYRFVIYVKHVTKNSDVEDSYKYVDVNITQQNYSKVSNFNYSGSAKEGSSISLNVSSNLPSETLYKIVACNRSTGEWITLSDWSTKTTATYKFPRGGKYTFVAYVKHKTKYLSEEDDYKAFDVNAEYTNSYIDDFTVSGVSNVGNPITMTATASPIDNTLYKFMVADRTTGKWITVKDWSTSNTATYTPVSKGTHRFVVYVKHKNNQSNSIEDACEYKDYIVGSRGTIVIDPGHGGSDPGAIGNGFLEKDGTLDISLRLKSKLESNGYIVYVTRNDDTYVDLYDRARLANNVKADLLVSIHHNSFNEKSTGIEVLYSARQMDRNIRSEAMSNGWSDPDITYSSRVAISSALASDLSSQLASSLGMVNRGGKEQNLAVCRNTAMPSILVEAGFISNPDDCNIVMTSYGKNMIATTIANVLTKYV